ncbi:hypothetical protein PMI04_005125 [Sphingobium sp. AP49]|uniref:hypothetical protein n=1 Tax=Sphingobium sp. AP49 TaxID=1144307 RepID=UPI00026EE1CE|nr:hypothetical protein [Sphingobium sp. AP49]WHO39978.1 hypothetical protein PMI04_005125 [Sphingobium sp. AP49]
MILLAHRGLWTQPDERNSRAALQGAFALGFGVETDVRDCNGRLVISHDMPTAGAMALEDLLADYDVAGRPGWLALNIKADGLAAGIEQALQAYPGMASQVFVFDMSVPDTLGYFGRSMHVFTRHSEFEPSPPLEQRCTGLWMDCFERPWVDPVDIVARIKRGQRVAIVSPELHGRTVYHRFWQLLRTEIIRAALPADLLESSLMLCTDFPREAAAYFSLRDSA